MAKQLNIFINNKPGRLQAITGLLSENGINIRALTIQDRGDFGMVKLLLDRPQDGYLVLSENGFACALKDIIAVLIDDRPGGLYNFVTLLQDKGINIKDAYGFLTESHKKAVFCVEVEEPKRARDIVRAAGFDSLEEHELYTL